MPNNNNNNKHEDSSLTPNSNILLPQIGALSLSELQVDLLVSAMSQIAGGSSSIDAGYVYFGQFIAHDMSAVSRFLSDDQEEPTPGLDLDTMYGPHLNGHVTSIVNERFVFGGTAEESNREVDFSRINGKASIEDQRNDENLIIAQMQVFWMKLHNFFFDKTQSFSEARKLVTAVYQNTIIEEFLKVIVCDSVFQAVCVSGQKLLPWPAELQKTKVPLEFAGAAFRFGHSMVRSSYLLQTRQPEPTFVKLKELFELTGRTGMLHGSLPSNRVIDWFEFFSLSPKITTNKASKIDPSIASGMLNSESVKLAKKNLESGSKFDLPSGPDLAIAVKKLIEVSGSNLQIQVFDQRQHFENAKYYGESAQKCEMNSLTILNLFANMPLWYYLLAEDFMEHPNVSERGNHLGTLGSILVAETIYTLVQASRFSILGKDKAYVSRAKTELNKHHKIDPVMTQIMGTRIFD